MYFIMLLLFFQNLMVRPPQDTKQALDSVPSLLSTMATEQ